MFLWNDERDSISFEYESSPINRELPIRIPNLGGKLLGWRRWNYEGTRKICKATTAVGGKLKAGAAVTGWKAEMFIPFELLTPLRNVPPQHTLAGEFYRVTTTTARPRVGTGRVGEPMSSKVWDAGVRLNSPEPER